MGGSTAMFIVCIAFNGFALQCVSKKGILGTKGQQPLRQSDYGSPLELTLPNLLFATHRKVPNHSPWNNLRQGYLEWKFPCAIQYRFKHLCWGHSTHMDRPFLGLLPDSVKITWFLDLTVQVCMEDSGIHGGWNQPWLFLQLNTLPSGNRFQ
jgi:hypothetical protein